MYWYVILAVFAANIFWACVNWKKEWDEIIWSVRNTPIMKIDSKILTRAMFSFKVIFMALISWAITSVFPPFMFIGILLVGAAYLSKLAQSDIVKMSWYPLICILKFAADLTITLSAAKLFGFYGFFGSAMAVFMSNALSVTFFIPKKGHMSAVLEADDDFTEDLKNFDEETRGKMHNYDRIHKILGKYA